MAGVSRIRNKRAAQVVTQPPPEAAPRVHGGGAWGPSAFDLPDPAGNHKAVAWMAVTGAAVVLALVGFLTIFYFHVT